MGSPTPGRVALFSIKPRYAEAILGGTKQVEFRRTPLAADVSHVVIYATAPIKKIVGLFEVAGVERAMPRSLWRSYREVGAIDSDDFNAYFAGTDVAYAIKVRGARRLRSPLDLCHLSPTLRAPQSYQYLRADFMAELVRHLESSPPKRHRDTRRSLAAAGSNRR